MTVLDVIPFFSSLPPTLQTLALPILADFWLGFMWYGVVFAAPWLQAMRKDKGNAQWPTSPSMLPNLLIGLIATALQAFVLSHILAFSGVATTVDAVVLALILYVGIVIPTYFPTYAWSARPVALVLIDGSFYLARIILMLVLLHARI